MKKKRGRPRKIADEKLSETITVMVTKEEADALYRRARGLRQDLSPLIRFKLKDLGFLPG